MHWRAEQGTAVRMQGGWCTGAQSEAGLDRARSGRSPSNDWSSNRPRQTPNAWALVHAENVDRTFRGSTGAALGYPGCQHARGASSPSHTARIPPPPPFLPGNPGLASHSESASHWHSESASHSESARHSESESLSDSLRDRAVRRAARLPHGPPPLRRTATALRALGSARRGASQLRFA